MLTSGFQVGHRVRNIRNLELIIGIKHIIFIKQLLRLGARKHEWNERHLIIDARISVTLTQIILNNNNNNNQKINKTM